MSGNEDLQKKLTAFSENWSHARHVENERLTFTQIYAGIVAGVLALRTAFHIQNEQIVLMVLLLIGSLGFLLTVKLTYEFKNHISKIQEMLVDDTLKKYVTLQLSGGIFTFIKVRILIQVFYMAVCSFIMYLVISNKYSPIINSGIIAGQLLLMLTVIILSNIEFDKKLKIRRIIVADPSKSEIVLQSANFMEINSIYQKIEKTQLIEKYDAILQLKNKTDRPKLEDMSLKDIKKAFKKEIHHSKDQMMKNI